MPSAKLSDLKGEIISLKERPRQSDCLFFICPACDGSHGIMVAWEQPPLYANGVVWRRKGNDIEDMSLTPSIDCTRPIVGSDGKVYENDCKFHGVVTNGRVVW